MQCSVYFWNEVTGDTQLEDPGDVPLHDEEGNCFWLDDQGNRLDRDPNVRTFSTLGRQPTHRSWPGLLSLCQLMSIIALALYSLI